MPDTKIDYGSLSNLATGDLSDIPAGIDPNLQFTSYRDDEDKARSLTFDTIFSSAGEITDSVSVSQDDSVKINYGDLKNVSPNKPLGVNYGSLSSSRNNYNPGSKEESWFLDELPDFVKAGYNQSIQGIAYQIAHGGTPKYEDVPEELEPLQDVMATVWSFFQPLDFAAMLVGGGVGGLAVKTAVKASSMRLISSLATKKIARAKLAGKAVPSMKEAVWSAGRVVDKAVGRGMMKATSAAVTSGISGATGLGFYSGLGVAAQQALQEGDFGEGFGHFAEAAGKRMTSDESLKAMMHGAILGGVTGGTGGFLKRKGWKMTSRMSVEIAEFANLATMLEKGEIARPKDYAHAAGVILGIKGVRGGGLYTAKGIKSGLTNSIRKFVPENRFIIKGGEKRVDVMKWRTKDGKEYNREGDIPEDATLKSVYVTDPVKGSSWWAESTKFFSRYESAKGFIGRMIEAKTDKAYEKFLKTPITEEETIDRNEIQTKVNKGVAPSPGEFKRLLGYMERDRVKKLSDSGIEEAIFESDAQIKNKIEYRDKLRSREVPYKRGDIKLANDAIRNLKKTKKDYKNILKMSEKLGIREFNPFNEAKIDVGKKPALFEVAVQVEKKRKDLAENDMQWMEYRKKRFDGKEKLEDFTTEELAQYVSFLQTGKRRRKNTSFEVRRRYSEYVRAKELLDIEQNSSYAKSIVDRTTKSFLKNSEKKLKQFFPTEEGVANLGDNYSYGLYVDILDAVKRADNVVHAGFMKSFGDRAFEIMGNRDPSNYRNKKFTQQIVNYLLTGSATSEKVSKMGELIKEFDLKYSPETRAARALSYFRVSSSVKGKILPIIPESDLKKVGIDIDFIKSEILEASPKLKQATVESRAKTQASKLFMKSLEVEYQKLLEVNTPDKASELFVEKMRGYTFGTREKYIPVDYHRPVDKIVEEMLSPSTKAGAPLGRLMRRRGEGVADPEKFWGWFDNRAYKDHMVIYGTPRVENFTKRLSQLNPKNQDSIKPFVQSIFKYSDVASTKGKRAVQGFSGMVYKAWLMSAYPSIRNLFQNVGRSAWFPIENIDLFMERMRRMTPKEREYFRQSIDQTGGVEQAHYLSLTIFKDAPLPIRKYERLVNQLSRHYTYSDKINRTMLMYWLMPLDGHVQSFKAGRITDKQLFQRLKLEQSNDVVKQRMLNKLYNESTENFMGEYIRQKMVDVHHVYTRYERPLFMQDPKYRPLTGLMTYSVSSLSKAYREVKLLWEGRKEMPGFGKRQILQVLINQAGNFSARHLARAAAMLAGADVVEKLTDKDDKEAYKKLKVEELYDTMQWMVPSVAANKMVEKITGRPAKYGLEEINIGMPLQAGLAEDVSGLFRTAGQYFDSGDEDDYEKLLFQIEDLGVASVPLLDSFFSFMSAHTGLLRGRLFEDFIPYLNQGDDSDDTREEKMRMIKLRFRNDMAQRYNYISSKEFDKFELLYRQYVQMPIIRGNRSLTRLRSNAIDPLVQSIVLDDIAAKVARINTDEADKMKRLADELMEEYESKRKLVPQLPGPVQGGRVYAPGEETIRGGLQKYYPQRQYK